MLYCFSCRTFILMGEKMSEQEKRHYVRIHFERQVQIEFFTDVYDNCQVKNISLGGIFVIGKFSHNLDDQCYVNFTQKSKETYLTFQALAKVIRQETEGIGLKFTSMSFESLLSLEMILLYQAREQSSDSKINLPKDLPFKISEETSNIPDKFNPFLDRTK